MELTAYFWFIMAYIVVVLCYGLYIAKTQVKNNEEFVTCGRRLPLWVVVGTLIATWYGGGGITGTANLVYSRGPWAGLIYELATPVAIILVLFLAGRIRENKNITIPELFREKYGDAAAVLATIFIVLAYIGICSYQFKGAGYVLNLTTGLSVESGTLLAAIVIILLSVTGGLTSVAYTDAVSAIFIFVSMGAAVPVLLSQTGGFEGLIAQIPANHLSFSSGDKFIDTIGYGVATLFLAMGDQNLFIRFAAAKDKKTATRSAFLFIIISTMLSCMTVFIAMNAIPFLPDIKPDTALLAVAMHRMPFFLGGCVLAAAVSFMITTGDSFLLSAGTNLTHDVLEPYVMKGCSEEKKLRTIRILIVVCGIFSYILITTFRDILGIIMYAYTIYGAAITPALVAALCWPRVTRAAGLSSIIAGGASTLIWELFLKNRISTLDSALVAVPISIAVLITVTFLTTPGFKLTKA
ncbi:MAG: sodium:solute symporter family protein [Cloacibacillus sp.]